MTSVLNEPISYDRDDIADEAKARTSFADAAVVKVVVESIQKKEFDRAKDAVKGTCPPGTKGLSFNVRMAVLDPETEEPLKPPLYMFVGVPLKHPAFLEDEKGDTIKPAPWISGRDGQWSNFVSPLMDEAGYGRPAFVDGNWTYQDKVIDRADIPECEEKAAVKRVDLIEEMWNEDLCKMNEQSCFATIKVDKEDGRAQLQRLRPRLKAGESLTSKAALFGDSVGGTPAGEATAAPRPKVQKKAKVAKKAKKKVRK